MIDFQPPYVDREAERQFVHGTSPLRRALFLDRDGVINVDKDYVHSIDQVEWVPGIFERVRNAVAQGMVPVVITNQAGIARGYYSRETFLDFTGWMHEVFRAAGSPLLATYYCPHHPEAGSPPWRVVCRCRKPAPGLILKAAEDWGIDLPNSMLVGDKNSDIEAAEAAGIRHHELVPPAVARGGRQAEGIRNATDR